MTCKDTTRYYVPCIRITSQNWAYLSRPPVLSMYLNAVKTNKHTFFVTHFADLWADHHDCTRHPCDHNSLSEHASAYRKCQHHLLRGENRKFISRQIPCTLQPFCGTVRHRRILKKKEERKEEKRRGKEGEEEISPEGPARAAFALQLYRSTVWGIVKGGEKANEKEGVVTWLPHHANRTMWYYTAISRTLIVPTNDAYTTTSHAHTG